MPNTKLTSAQVPPMPGAAQGPLPVVPAPVPPPVPMPLMPGAAPAPVPPAATMPAAPAKLAATPVAEPPPWIDWVHAASLIGDPPPRQWLVKDMLVMGTVGLLYGDGGTGKSLLAMQLAVAVSTGRRWLTKPVKSGPVIYYSCEDNKDEIHRRLTDICRSERITTSDLAALMIADMAGAAETLLASIGKKNGAMSPTVVFTKLDEVASGLKPALVVVDTLADVFPGNENDRTQVRHFIGLMRQLSRKHGCAVVLLAHPSLTGMATGTGASGSTAWSNSVRSRLYFDRVKVDGNETDPDVRRLAVKKSNYGAIGEEILVRWQQGVFVPCYTPPASENDARAERIFLQLIADNAARGRTFTDARAHAELEKMPAANGLSKKVLLAAKERLFNAGKLQLIEERKDGKPRTVLAVVDDAWPNRNRD